MSRLHYTTHLTNNQQLLLCNTHKLAFTNVLQLKIFLAKGTEMNVILLNKDEIGRNLVPFGEVRVAQRVRVWRRAARDENGKITTFGDFTEISP